MKKHLVTLIPGDGIGPEVATAARRVLDASGAHIEWEEAEAGASVFLKGSASGVPKETIESLSRTRVALKGPLETPVGAGEKSANVTLRKLFETFANVRPIREFPGVTTPFSGRGIDLVVVRENVEDLYAGIEHMQTSTVAQCLKLISRKGCEKVMNLAFALARAEGRKTIHCATKANIMKLTEGMMKRVFEETASRFPEMRAQHIVVDNCAHQLVKKPEQFDVIVTTNMNGDILSDLTSALVGGLGFAPSANLGSDACIFEAVHGSAPKYAGKDVANPTAMILSGVMMLRHLGEMEAAARIERSVTYTLSESKIVTRDVTTSSTPVGTRAFADAIIANFDKATPNWKGRDYQPLQIEGSRPVSEPAVAGQRRTIGIDVFVEAHQAALSLGETLRTAGERSGFHLKMISNRGTQVFPSRGASTDFVDHWRCRFLANNPADDLSADHLTRLLAEIQAAGLRWMHLEKLQEFEGKPGFTKAQGED